MKTSIDKLFAMIRMGVRPFHSEVQAPKRRIVRSSWLLAVSASACVLMLIGTPDIALADTCDDHYECVSSCPYMAKILEICEENAPANCATVEEGKCGWWGCGLGYSRIKCTYVLDGGQT